MRETEYARKMDTAGRLVIPAPLREQTGLQPGDIYKFHLHETQDGKIYLCIECPGIQSEIEKAKELLRNAGYTI